MRLLRLTGGALALGLLVGGVALAQVKELPGERVTKTGTVEAIDHKARVLTLKNEKGEMVTVDVPAAAPRFDAVKVGDKVTVTYYDNVTVRLKKPGEAAGEHGRRGLDPDRGDQAGRHRGRPANHDRQDRGHRREGAVDHLRGTELVEVQPAGPGQGRPQAGQGRGPGGLHLDRGHPDLGRGPEEVATASRP